MPDQSYGQCLAILNIHSSQGCSRYFTLTKSHTRSQLVSEKQPRMALIKGLNSLTNASIDGLVNGTVDSILNKTFSSLFNTTYNKNGTEGAVVETILNLIKVGIRSQKILISCLSIIDMFTPTTHLRVTSTGR